MQDFNSMVATVNSVLSTINSVVSEMPNGNRYQLKDLARIVSDKCGMEIDDVMGFIQYFSHHTDMGYVSRGKNGGFIRGSKQEKPTKAPKAKVISEASAEDSAEEST